MRIFKDRIDEMEYDLDNPETYKHLPDNTKELRALMFSHIGYYYCYVTYFRPGWDKKQVDRIEKMIKCFADDEKQNYNNILWYQEQIFLFEDEIENMC